MSSPNLLIWKDFQINATVLRLVVRQAEMHKETQQLAKEAPGASSCR